MPKKFINEFKEFAVKGNVIDLAIGVVIGTAFGKITASLVSDIFMPVIGLLTGNVSFEDKKIILREATDSMAALTLNYGALLQTLFNFVIIAFAMFLAVKLINRMKRQEEKAAKTAAPAEDVILLREIRDLLKKKK